ncbi:MAG TPA: hypothetical protein VGV39_00310 [Mesorhizobium sp.]|jgi:prophage tail gpP-like protein|uniref:phage baseplate assembly protein n=1 Tax=Mesorhizobium sp. TaxID=1871066 RepID=UPI002DDCD11B|nr:hypothetical protein [Mesorhizobium sp.]HEV2501483.1 hypothetical protein [Mesorhizobium sp.]
MYETVVFNVAGRPLPHKACRLSASAEGAVREATFTVIHVGAGIPCQPDDVATIAVSGEVWGTGYVRDVRGSHGETDRSYEVTFVSRTIDAVECSIDHPTGYKKDCDLLDIAREFDTLGIGVEGSPKTERKARHKVIPGESLFQTLETDARAQGVLIQDTEKGKLKLADKPEGRHAGGLVRGRNIKQADAQITGAGRFSSVKVRGQNSTGVASPALRSEGAATDDGVKRKRPRILPYEGEATSARLKKRAKWEAQRGAGNGTSCSIVTPGWRDGAGRLWTRNYLVPVDDDWLGINQDMVIAEVVLEQGADANQGTVATLSLKDPRALGGDNPRGSSASGWGAPLASDPSYRDEGE